MGTPEIVTPGARRRARVVGVLLAAALLLTGGLTGAATATADDLDDQRAAAEAKQRAKERERDELSHELEDSNAKYRQAVLDLNEVEARLPVAQAELAEARAALEEARRKAEILAQRLADAEREEASVAAQLDAGEGKVEEVRADVVEMARQAYRNGDDPSTIGIVTGAQSTQEFLEEFAVSSSAARSQARTLTELQDAEAVAKNQQARLDAIRATVALLKEEADANVVAAQKAERAAADRKAEVEQLIARQTKLKASIAAQRDEAIAELEENDQQRAALEGQLKEIISKQKARDARIAEQRRKAEAEQRRKEAAAAKARGDGKGSGKGSGGGGGSSSGPFLGWPTNYHVVTSSYGMRFHPTLHYWRLHAGTDIRSYCRTPIYSSQSGYVEQAHFSSGGGNNVLVNHGTHRGKNVMTRYLHLSYDTVSVGEYVDKGEVIGYSGSTGTSAACHLHFEVYVNGSTTDPMGGWLN
ncbi:peptidoglycan DD-metalloendopeptidase family protein [Isoptericola sp. NEAU-Y5]|uniref:Peptidoglycan DD-metalloendopeptidase family protein n=1 Tax=Isoptericola luteus TaxID=2879484 RepID=A0ABS7ZFZ6_9MICO|nr:M23 family metallopeptidase [Isoptericola sp. NEAU-Y5]MCA5893397.1 peptidoglycan DD-metalloendopeptidase family protein [Isoptericola sp. NEAU-Y5]